jgi:penicillin amidase
MTRAIFTSRRRRPLSARGLTLSLVAAVALISAARAQTPAPARQASKQQLSVAGLKSAVIIRRDARGVPYVEAANERDLYFAQGYVTASDRLWQMDLLRRTGRGELAEVLGRDTLEEDKRRRLYGFAKLSEESLQYFSTPMRAAYESYARGVNAYIASLTDETLPAEFRLLRYKPRPWTAADSVIVGKIFAETLSTSWQTDLMRAAFEGLPRERRDALMPETSPLDVVLVGRDGAVKKSVAKISRSDGRGFARLDADILSEASEAVETMQLSLARVGAYAEGRAASNNWVVGGRLTASGKPLLANDPHLAPSAPSIWYMTHLSAPGLRVAGVTAPGAPGILIGHNERIAWGLTNLAADVQDLYAETFDKERPQFYRTPAGWRQAEVRHEEIKVRKSAADASTETIPFDVTVTRNGPIVLKKGATDFALRWTSLDPHVVELESFHAINRARNWDEFRAALRRHVCPMQNFVYMDTAGHIGYYGAGRVPIRKTGDGRLPYDGGTDAGEWIGYIPFDALPHVYDPPSGIIVTANNRIVGDDYRYHLTHEWSSPYRARRILSLLQSRRGLTAEDFREIQADTYSTGTAVFARELLKVAGEETAAPGGAESWNATLRLAEGWDGRMNGESAAAPLLVAMRNAFRRRMLLAALGAELAKSYRWANSDTFIDQLITERPRAMLPKEFASYGDLLRACAEEAREGLTKQFGADASRWTWNAFSQVRFFHPLAGVPQIGQQFLVAGVPAEGSNQSVNVGAGVSMRLIADASDWDKTRQGITLGISGDPASPHWKDQLADWRAVRPGVFPFRRETVVGSTEATLTLTPAAK